jgi:hypothetical protein
MESIWRRDVEVDLIRQFQARIRKAYLRGLAEGMRQAATRLLLSDAEVRAIVGKVSAVELRLIHAVLLDRARQFRTNGAVEVQHQQRGDSP